jgi:hypothetical protein
MGRSDRDAPAELFSLGQEMAGKAVGLRRLRAVNVKLDAKLKRPVIKKK